MDPRPTPAAQESDFWRRLLHRWFVQYNPTYLLSAALVLAGVILVSRGLAAEGSYYGALGVAGIAEVYAFALIGCAALLTRIGQRRPGVLLALIALLYQSDLTLHTETCAYLGRTGVVAAAAWVGLFVLKLYALARALHLRLSDRAVATAALGASVLAIGPLLMRVVAPAEAGISLSVLVFALLTLAPRTAALTARSTVPLDAWGETVLRRSLSTAWGLWSVALGAHVLFWSSQRALPLGYAAVAVALFMLSSAARESRVWIGTVVLLVGSLLFIPGTVSGCALLITLALARRAFASLSVSVPAGPSGCAAPYRAADGAPDAVRPPSAVFVAVDRAARIRLLSGAMLGLYLSGWTFGHQDGGLPAHTVSLDLVLGAFACALAWRFRSRVPLVPLGMAYTHALLVSGLVPRPRTLLGWGATAVAFGFVLLFGSVATSYRLRDVQPD